MLANDIFSQYEPVFLRDAVFGVLDLVVVREPRPGSEKLLGKAMPTSGSQWHLDQNHSYRWRNSIYFFAKGKINPCL